MGASPGASKIRVTVIEHYGGESPRIFEGPEHNVRRDLLARYSWLVPRCGYAPIAGVVRELDRAQAYTAVLESGLLVSESPS
jgi:hypothetical protein